MPHLDTQTTTTAGVAIDGAVGDRRRANLVRGFALLLGLALAMVVTIGGSRAAFTARTDNDGNKFDTGTVVLTDDDAETAMFDVSGLNGGQTLVRCINVAYTGSLAADVRLHSAVGGTGLAAGLATKVDIGTGATGGKNADRAGFSIGSNLFDSTLASLGTSHANYGTGLPGWANATNPSSRSYRITVTVSNDAAYMGKTATVDLTWEAQGKNA